MTKPKIGDTFYYVETRSNYPRRFSVEVAKVGRRWAHIGVESEYGNRSVGRFDFHQHRPNGTFQVDGGNYMSPAKLYASEEHYNRCIVRWRLSKRLIRATRQMNRIDDSVTVEDIRRAAELLKIDLGEFE